MVDYPFVLLEYTHDALGQIIKPGDWVARANEFSNYKGWERGEAREVRKIMGFPNGADRITMRNPRSQFGTSDYHAHNFVLVRKGKEPMCEKKNTLHVAIEVGNSSYADIAGALNTPTSANISSLTFGVSILADVSGDILKARIEQRIRAKPTERWLILSGTVIGEISAPPVRFIPA